MPQFAKRQMKPVGRRSRPTTELVGRTMAIVGWGDRGAMARRAHYGFDMKIIATDAKPIPKPEYVEELHAPDTSRRWCRGPMCWWRRAADAGDGGGCSTSRCSGA